MHWFSSYFFYSIQDEIYDVKYHLNELKHSISVSAIDDVIALHDDENDDQNKREPMNQSESEDEDLNQSHSLDGYMAHVSQSNDSMMDSTTEPTPDFTRGSTAVSTPTKQTESTEAKDTGRSSKVAGLAHIAHTQKC